MKLSTINTSKLYFSGFNFDKSGIKPSDKKGRNKKYQVEVLDAQKRESIKNPTLATLEMYFEIPSESWLKGECFAINYEDLITNKGLLRIPHVDTENELNAENLSRLDGIKDCAMTKTDIAIKYSLMLSEISTLTSMGFLNPLLLKTNKGNNATAAIYDMSDSENQIAANRLRTKKSPIHKKLASTDLPVYVPIAELPKYGFGSTGRIYKAIQDKKLHDTIEEVKDLESGEKEIKINMNDTVNERMLTLMRDSHCVSNDNIEDKFGVSIFDYYKAIYNREIIPLQGVFIGDLGIVRADYRNPINRYAINQLTIQSLAQRIILEDNERINSTLLAKVIKGIYPEVTKAALAISEGDEELINALDKKAKFEKYYEDVNINYALNRACQQTGGNDDDVVAGIRVYLPTKKEIELIENFNKKLISMLDANETESKINEALRCIRLYKKSGINAIDNPEAKKAIQRF